MAVANNDFEAAFQEYLASTEWASYEDPFDTAEYIPEMLLELHGGVEAEREEEILGELFSRIYYQERLTTAIQVTIRPLLLLCILDKIQSKDLVLELLLDIEQRYLYLKGVIGVMPAKYAYLGEVYDSEQEAATSIEIGEKPYYELIQQQRDLLVVLFSNQSPLIRNLAIKAYGLSALTANREAPALDTHLLLQQVSNDTTAGNTLVALGMVARLSGQPLLIPAALPAGRQYQQHIAVAEGLAGTASPETIALLKQIEADPADYNLLPWYRGDLQLLALAGLANSIKNDPSITGYLFEVIRQLKKQPVSIPPTELKTYEVAAEFLASAYFSSLVPAAHKRGNEELTPEQLAVVKKLSGELKIITNIQVVAGLPESIKAVNSFAGLAQ
ncbi:hypothetical protein HB364_25335 [Pseudoflavitalea sp. X16]|uniref:hypothetical protein n=1 Tax=Paraflavitalea devenefica TaxID=2716334 RepID=UPI00141DA65E|nr:hypothetical protein [Paraflavitalea devenefica]NII28431.1 hypothetical protein [Paraflavitalea devenefica]